MLKIIKFGYHLPKSCVKTNVITLRCKLLEALRNSPKENGNFISTYQPKMRTVETSFITKTTVEKTQPNVVNIIENMSQFGFTEDETKMLLETTPELEKVHSSSWGNVVQVFSDGGFAKKDILQVLAVYPKVLSLKEKDLINNIEAWLKARFNTKVITDIILKNPQFLQMNANYLEKRLQQFQLHFEDKKGIGKLLLLAPNVLEEDEKVILKKLNYLNELCAENSEIISSGVLAHNYLHITARHEFLIRTGVYKKPKKDFIKNLSTNPKLSRIVNTSNAEFANKVARLSLFEYEVFLEMFESEFDETE